MDEKCILDPERECIGSARALLLEKRIEALEEWQRDSKQFHTAFYDWQREQIAREAKLDEQLNSINRDIKKPVSWQEAEQSAPKRRWEAHADRVIWTVLAAVIAFLLGRIGLSV